jgi:hypothetical protein
MYISPSCISVKNLTTKSVIIFILLVFSPLCADLAGASNWRTGLAITKIEKVFLPTLQNLSSVGPPLMLPPPTLPQCAAFLEIIDLSWEY